MKDIKNIEEYFNEKREARKQRGWIIPAALLGIILAYAIVQSIR